MRSRAALSFRLYMFLLAATAFASTGCSRSEDASSSEADVAPIVLVVGDETAEEAMKRLRSSTSIRFSSDLSDETRADFVVLVQNSLEGPTPRHKELISKFSKRGSGELLCVMTNTEFVDDLELLELEELDLREAFSAHGLPGDEIPFAFDSEGGVVNPNSDVLQGWPPIAKYVASRARTNFAKP